MNHKKAMPANGTRFSASSTDGFFAICATPSTPRSESPAPDGEEYWVTALYFASGRWGDGQGIYNYRAMADSLTLVGVYEALEREEGRSAAHIRERDWRP